MLDSVGGGSRRVITGGWYETNGRDLRLLDGQLNVIQISDVVRLAKQQPLNYRGALDDRQTALWCGYYRLGVLPGPTFQRDA